MTTLFDIGDRFISARIKRLNLNDYRAFRQILGIPGTLQWAGKELLTDNEIVTETFDKLSGKE